MYRVRGRVRQWRQEMYEVTADHCYNYMHVQILKGENLLLELLPNARSNGHVPDLTFRPVVDSFKPGRPELSKNSEARCLRSDMQPGIQTRPAALVRGRPYVFQPLTFLTPPLNTENEIRPFQLFIKKIERKSAISHFSPCSAPHIRGRRH